MSDQELPHTALGSFLIGIGSLTYVMVNNPCAAKKYWATEESFDPAQCLS